VGKLYRTMEERPTLLRSAVPIRRPARHDLWALRDIELEIQAGETVGILGHNGAGKTTLLRLLAGVTRPTVGHVRVEGRIGPLIGLGVGFEEEASGRENVLFNGALLGLSVREVQKRFDEIVAFAELEKFIDTPVKFYSSGMRMRLAFGVLAYIDPTILLVDEVLAVGDARFQIKCFDRLRALQEQGAAILMVSHAMHMVRQLCDRGVLIRRGEIVYDGDLEQAIRLHEQSFTHSTELRPEARVEILECRFAEGLGQHPTVAYNEPIAIELRVRFRELVDDPVVFVGAVTETGLLAGFNVTPTGQVWRTFAAGQEATSRISFPARLAGGTYRIVVEVRDRSGTGTLASADDLMLTVRSRDGCEGISDVCAELELVEPARSS
jgi:lipopolysaccharide transport system ATP-binding protein